MSAEQSKSLDDLCIWHKNKSIAFENKMYMYCHILCSGYLVKCGKYQPTKPKMTIMPKLSLTDKYHMTPTGKRRYEQ